MPGDGFYRSPAWKALRIKVLRRDRYICCECGKPCLGRKKNGLQPIIDHAISRRKRPDLSLDITNLVVMCQPCHNKKTYRSDVQSKKAVEIGVDGYPVEQPE